MSKKSKNVTHWAERQFLALRRKQFISNFWFYFLNIVSFVIAAATVIFNLWAFKFNDVQPSLPYFIALSILAGIAAFATSLVSLFSFRKTANQAREKIEMIKNEEEAFNKKDGEYSETNEPSKLFIKNILQITDQN